MGVDRKHDLQIQSNGLTALQRLDAKLCSVDSELAELKSAQKQVLEASDNNLQIAFDDSRQSLQVSSLIWLFVPLLWNVCFLLICHFPCECPYPTASAIECSVSCELPSQQLMWRQAPKYLFVTLLIALEHGSLPCCPIAYVTQAGTASHGTALHTILLTLQDHTR